MVYVFYAGDNRTVCGVLARTVSLRTALYDVGLLVDPPGQNRNFFEHLRKVFGISRNIYDPTRGVGGSSGGDAGIVAANGAVLALGSDVAGSLSIGGGSRLIEDHRRHELETDTTNYCVVGTENSTMVAGAVPSSNLFRNCINELVMFIIISPGIPAAFCGIVGFKPTPERLNIYHRNMPRVREYGTAFLIPPVPGPMGKSCDDVEALMYALLHDYKQTLPVAQHQKEAAAQPSAVFPESRKSLFDLDQTVPR